MIEARGSPRRADLLAAVDSLVLDLPEPSSEMTGAELLRYTERTIESEGSVTVQLWFSDPDDMITTLTRVPAWGAIHLDFSLDGFSPAEATNAAATLFAANQRATCPAVFWAVDRTGITEIYGDPHLWGGDQRPGWPPRTD